MTAEKSRDDVLNRIFSISERIVAFDGIDDIFEHIVKTVTLLTGAEAATIRVFDLSTGKLKIAKGFGLSSGFLSQPPIKIGEGITGKVVLDGKPFLTSNVLEVGHCVHKELAMLEGIRAVMSIPLKIKKGAFGCITVYKKTPDPFTEHDILVSSIFASQIAEVIEKMYFIEELKIQATFDSLTGVYNKNALIKELNSEIKLTLRHGHETSIIFIDIDNFKDFNDTHGHLLGDKLLADFAGLLRQHCRKTDMIGRFGGEEFVAVALHTDKAGALGLADKMRETVSSHKFTGKDEHVCITFSAGISSMPEDGTEATEVLEKADDAMYQSKRNGKNCVTIFSPQFTAY